MLIPRRKLPARPFPFQADPAPAPRGLLVSEWIDGKSPRHLRWAYRAFPSLRSRSLWARRANAVIDMEAASILESLCFGSGPSIALLKALPLELSISVQLRSLCLFALGEEALPDTAALLADDLAPWEDRIAISRAASEMILGARDIASCAEGSLILGGLDTLQFLREAGLASWPSKPWLAAREAEALGAALPGARSAARSRAL